MAGHITNEDGQAGVWQRDVIEIVSAEYAGHAVFDPDAVPGADRRAFREQESAVIQFPTVSGTVQGIYLFFASEKRKMYSKDQYFGI